MSDDIPAKTPGKHTIVYGAILHLGIVDFVLRDLLPQWPGCELWLGHYVVLGAGASAVGFLLWASLYLPLNNKGENSRWLTAAGFIVLITPAFTLLCAAYFVISSRGLALHP